MAPTSSPVRPGTRSPTATATTRRSRAIKVSTTSRRSFAILPAIGRHLRRGRRGDRPASGGEPTAGHARTRAGVWPGVPPTGWRRPPARGRLIEQRRRLGARPVAAYRPTMSWPGSSRGPESRSGPRALGFRLVGPVTGRASVPPVRNGPVECRSGTRSSGRRGSARAGSRPTRRSGHESVFQHHPDWPCSPWRW